MRVVPIVLPFGRSPGVYRNLTSPDDPMTRSPDSSPARFFRGPMARYSVLRHGTNSHLHPLVFFVLSLDLDLQIIVAECFAHFGTTFRQCDCLKCSSHKGTTKREVLLRSQIPQFPISFSRDLNGDLVRHGGCGRAGARRICEHMEIRKRQLCDEAARFLEQFV